MKNKILIVVIVIMFITTPAFTWPNAEQLYSKADKAYMQGDYSDALDKCKRVLNDYKISRFRDDAHYLAGLSLLKLGRYESARSYFYKVVSRKPASPLEEDAYLGAADSYLLEKKYDKARELYQEILIHYANTDYRDTISQRLQKIKTDTKKKPKKAKSRGGSRTAPTSSKYTVQIGCFRNKSNANALYRKFKKLGYSAYIISGKMDGVGVYKVRIGKFSSEKKAESFAKKLRRNGYETKVTSWQKR